MKIRLDGHRLTLEELVAVARLGAAAEIPGEARAAMEKSRRFVEELASQPRGIYGINTGFGPLCRTRVSPEDYARHQQNLIHHLSVGQGEPFDEAETRAIMTARANALARGYSGIRPEVVENLVAFINRRVHPEIPSEGSVGASGDLVPLAHMARTLLGLGRVRFEGGWRPASAVMESLGIEPVRLREKEGLALVNGTSAMTGLAALHTVDAMNLLSTSELLTALFTQVLYGEPEPFCSRVAFARGHRGQSVAAERIAEYLRSNPGYREKIDRHRWGTYSKPVEAGHDVQDPYSIRCVPQILGAIQDALWHIQAVVFRELNSATDNPMVFPVEEMVIHCGNFYGQHVSMTMDYLRIAVAKAALLAERQIERLVNDRYNLGLPAMLTEAELGLNSGFMGAQLLSTSLAAEIRMLSTPASIQTIPTNANNQDMVSMGLHASRAAGKMLPLAWKICGVLGLCLAQAFEIRNDSAIDGPLFRDFLDNVRTLSPRLEEDRPLYEDIGALSAHLRSPDFQSHFCPPRPPAPES
jgi:tyrosine ammonia-lyase